MADDPVGQAADSMNRISDWLVQKSKLDDPAGERPQEDVATLRLRFAYGVFVLNQWPVNSGGGFFQDWYALGSSFHQMADLVKAPWGRSRKGRDRVRLAANAITTMYKAVATPVKDPSQMMPRVEEVSASVVDAFRDVAEDTRFLDSVKVFEGKKAQFVLAISSFTPELARHLTGERIELGLGGGRITR
jgi:hypothetical protein